MRILLAQCEGCVENIDFRGAGEGVAEGNEHLTDRAKRTNAASARRNSPSPGAARARLEKEIDKRTESIRHSSGVVASAERLIGRRRIRSDETGGSQTYPDGDRNGETVHVRCARRISGVSLKNDSRSLYGSHRTITTIPASPSRGTFRECRSREHRPADSARRGSERSVGSGKEGDGRRLCVCGSHYCETRMDDIRAAKAM